MIVFDLDGVLIDTQELIRKAYRKAGANPPPDFFSLGHHDWIPEEIRYDVHVKKNREYLRRLRAGDYRVLPPWDTATMLWEAGIGEMVGILSGAPRSTVEALQMSCPNWPFDFCRCAYLPEEKTDWLSGVYEGGVYVDDQSYVTMPEGWRRVLYTGQSPYDLYLEVTA